MIAWEIGRAFGCDSFMCAFSFDFLGEDLLDLGVESDLCVGDRVVDLELGLNADVITTFVDDETPLACPSK